VRETVSLGRIAGVKVGINWSALAIVVVIVARAGHRSAAQRVPGPTNMLLAVFNLIPAAPLDGGRVLRAAVWRRRLNRESAAVTAARAGRVVGFALVGIGLLESPLTGTLNGIWLALVGWFLISAATAEEQQARIGSRLSGVRVGDVMTGSGGDFTAVDLLRMARSCGGTWDE
jgi:Zn-dependent protease